jgi:hypothetical protein
MQFFIYALFIFYTMITKFMCNDDSFKSLEFSIKNKTELEVLITDEETNLKEFVTLKEKDLFNLIGQLLRVQSEIRKESSNG